ncbi:MAG: carboxypeptidase regulatory-like domain-containing protein, partial [Methylomicrobium sp.]|nr:carboxypeptidase regulatory-like domain-containing protein [Methylomicrobium sp.]
MSTMTIRVTSSALNSAGNWGQQTDFGNPSYLDMIVTGSDDNSPLPNGTYDAYCLHPFLILNPNTDYISEGFEGNSTNSDALNNYTNALASGTDGISAQEIQQINWLLAQNFTSDLKYSGQFNYGEVQGAIWQILGYSPSSYNQGTTPRLLSDNNRQIVNQDDIDFLVAQSLSAVTSGINVLPSDTYFSMLVDPAGNAQPLIVQLKSGKLGNYVWEDSNGNGIQDLGELGVNNVIVELYDGEGNFINSTVTGDDYSTTEIETGYYQFTGLAAGQYQVKFFTPEGMLLTAANVNSNNQDTVDSDAVVNLDGDGLSQIITLSAGESNQTIDAGIYKTATIGNFIWHDINKDGIQNTGEVGIEGVTVTLTGTTGAGQSVSMTTATDENGEYLFTDLAPGTYKVTIDASNFQINGALEDYISSPGNQGADTGIDSNNPDDSITLQSGDENLTVDYGFYKSEDVEPPKASIGDKVFNDANNNGVQDAGEAGVAGVTVKLFTCVNNAPGVQVGGAIQTDASGNYSFTGLMPGDYVVQFIAPNGTVLSTANIGGNDLVDSDAGLN